MTYLKFNSKSFFVSYSIALLLFLGSSLSFDLSAQDKVDLRLSLGAAAGYAPMITHGSTQNSGLVVGVFGELEYGKAIGRLQFSKPLLNTFQEDGNSEGGEGYHGSLGYRFDLADQLSLALLLSGGATVIHYRNGFNGSSGDRFTNVSPQVGINVIPAYQITDLLSVQAGLRYYKGFKAGDRGRASDVADILIGLRVSL